ncbi:hypothetical protein JOF53_003337 [Crossiella equi]|uniref:Dirigent-like protein n=1 Tax=Crossiella equi TaxID=130796 RepID=A0ABS5AD07_9PSEU|nr:hypothetical protein [Crossiella equi]MBP2474465.1 hypothetical protein [Crossiella equi]
MRRTVALAALLAATTVVPSAAAAPATVLEFTAKRKLITLADLPVPGASYAVRSELANTDGTEAGGLTISCTVVGVELALPPVVEAQCLHVYRFKDDAELHTTALVKRTLGSDNVHKQVVVGGTGRFKGAEGEGTIVFPDNDSVKYRLDFSV